MPKDKPLDEYVLEFWNRHGVVPSEIEPDLFDEIADALGNSAPPELIRTLRFAG